MYPDGLETIQSSINALVGFTSLIKSFNISSLVADVVNPFLSTGINELTSTDAITSFSDISFSINLGSRLSIGISFINGMSKIRSINGGNSFIGIRGNALPATINFARTGAVMILSYLLDIVRCSFPTALLNSLRLNRLVEPKSSEILHCLLRSETFPLV